MSSATRIGMTVGDFIGRAIDRLIGDKMREHFAKLYGSCSKCERPLSGASPSGMCEPCHADHVVRDAFIRAFEEAASEGADA